MPTAKPGHRKYTGPWTLTIASYFILPGALFVFLGLGLLVSIITAGNKPVATGVVTGNIAWEGFIIGGALLTLVGFGLIAYALRRYSKDKTKLQLQKQGALAQ
jgi:hypothetical protein